MLFKLSIGNMKKSVKDYAIYFFTLIIGVSVFYVFNAIGGQAAMMRISNRTDGIVEVLKTMLSGVSVFVAVILALLIVYASRFLMKRRHKEFAIYMTLGMSKTKISAILIIETVLVGVFSLAVGLIVGIGLSQLMSALVVNLFEADMSKYRLLVSTEAILKTCLFFAIMYAVVMVLNGVAVTRMKLIDMIQSGRKSENIKIKNPILCIVLFIVSVMMLGFMYYKVGWSNGNLDQSNIILIIIGGAICTFLIFWSISGLVLYILRLRKKSYYNGINTFTFRQISSKINTMVFSMTVICLMLFVTICTLTASFSVRNSMNNNIRTLCPVDAELAMIQGDKSEGIERVFEKNGYNISDYFSEYIVFKSYTVQSFTFKESLGDSLEEIKKKYAGLNYDFEEEIMGISDYNAIRKIQGKEPEKLDDGQYFVLCDYDSMENVRNQVLQRKPEINIMGHKLQSKYDRCLNESVHLSAQHLNIGIFVVPDSVVAGQKANSETLYGNYKAKGDEELQKMEKKFQKCSNTIQENMEKNKSADSFGSSINTKIDISNSAIGLGAIITFVGLYIGIIFLIACGAILALKELSECVDSIQRYEILRKIGTEEKDISRSLFYQTGIFFLLPLIVAAIHSVFGMKFSVAVMEIFGTEGIGESVFVTSLILTCIYGGYFLVTFFNKKNIIKRDC
ncbi:ABC transporter permease [Eubacterium xylanophilum]|uniref:ABC transporter permease n=1 Tax=Eubacterium xylanophilum TaxID=39497 RepID=UPI000478E7BC|nr:ABC transporter permease [Eubacterium xylanophilum]